MAPQRKSTKQYLREDSVIVDDLYPVISEVADKRMSAVKKVIEKFIQDRQKELYDYAPIDRIYFRKQDVDQYFKALTVPEKEVTTIISNLYYYKEDELQCCKDEFSLAHFSLLRWAMINKSSDKKLIELLAMYLSFSGKFYATCHAQWFSKFTPKREVMDYVVNYMLSNKFDLVKTGSVWGAIRELTMTWMDTYHDEIVGPLTDERLSYLFHQLHNRIYSFLRNIAKCYYEAYEKKLYLNAESDNYTEDKYRIANNNSTMASNITEKTMNYMTSSRVNFNVCQSVSSTGVDPYEIKAIIENILSKNESIDELRNVINILLVDFIKNYPEEKDLTGVKFISHSIAMKPNTKDKDLIYMKNTVLKWLSKSDRYNRIKTPATKNNYYKAILGYIAITVNTANKE